MDGDESAAEAPNVTSLSNSINVKNLAVYNAV